MSQIKTKFLENSAISTDKIASNAVTDAKIRLANNAYLRARNAADSADVDMLKVNASDVIEFASFPEKSGSPSTANQLVNKSYVDSLLNGLRWKEPVRAASTANVDISTGLENGDSLDGVTLATGDRVLLKNQSTASQNGIYVVVASGAASRSLDADSASEVESAAVFVKEGSSNADKAFVQTADGVTLGTTSLVWSQFSASAQAVSGKETFTLGAGDITNQYIDLGQVAETNSVLMLVKGAGYQLEGASHDFTVSYTGGSGGNTRISFVNDLATGGNAALIAGDVLQIMYRY
jgi:hypothetical protein